ncbi:division/cell wall cluster transcriptional repressor MraZ [Alicyclobacillus sp. ALC3]|uniref:division/cell wall cluster transcriptional repressor MraZ n=1 Tax=Alicyclobacillus sp. ALC3 TaxID=2796143 RepID=UPI00237872D2|nr:division/cell wall cluster transcriptional repressor MraZ [Alicyclobacillus sp. ALC3]WDL99286.1 division/cell wall cluster transcriptional repressor MraZ [Alicyclobacillus sp. ALC3]
MFMGEFQHTLDEKGRITMPVKYRDGLGKSFVITRGIDTCLFVYPMTEWETLESKLKALPLTRADARSFVRFFFSGATECELDKQGRALIPGSLRDYATLERDCVVIGVSNRVEIWSQSAWTEYAEGANESFAQLAEKLVDFDL